MKIILAQGNPGSAYTGTRHNIGWQILDDITGNLDLSFRLQAKFFAHVAETTIDGEKVLFVKPTTFYNETGRTARALGDFYKLTTSEDILVIHDDLSLPFGTLRIREKGSDAGNNGIKSITSHIGEHYWRIRVGIWHELRDQTDDVAFVLGKFDRISNQHINDTISPAVWSYIEQFCNGTLSVHSQSLIEK